MSERKRNEVAPPGARARQRQLGFIIAVRPSGHAFAVVVLDGDDAVSDMSGYELPGPMDPEQAAFYAAIRHGLDAEKDLPLLEDSSVTAIQFAANASYSDFCELCRTRMHELAPELNTKDRGLA